MTLNLSFVLIVYAAAAKALQSCPTLCDPIDGSPPGYPVPGILQARTLEWVASSFSNAWKWNVKVKSFSRVRLLVTPWTEAYQAPPSMGFSRWDYWSVGCHCLLWLVVYRCRYIYICAYTFCILMLRIISFEKYRKCCRVYTYKAGENVELYTLRVGTKMVFIAIHATSSSQET